jgi:1-acyl-sn-glycerol-3-phosphate acyltransferase
MFAFLVGRLVIRFAQFITGVRAIWKYTTPTNATRVYFANHVSHGDFILLWASLPFKQRRLTSPVAGEEYWLANPLRSYIIRQVFQAVLVKRNDTSHSTDPIADMTDAVHTGRSLILFPEGTRNTGDSSLLPFKSGIYHLACSIPEVEFIPVWISNLNRVMPKGRLLPLPLLSTVTFGRPIYILPNESKLDFIARCQSALLVLAQEVEI